MPDSKASSTTGQPAQPRSRRRGRKRDGPPQFQFVTATDPSQFKDESVKRSVRSQAMIQYRYKSSEEKAKEKETQQSRPSAPKLLLVTPPVVLDEGAYEDAWQPSHPWSEHETLYTSTSQAWRSAHSGQEMGLQPWVPYAAVTIPFRPSRYITALAAIPLNEAAQRVLDYENTEEHAQRFEVEVIEIVSRLAPLHAYGMDPFKVMPEFASGELDSFNLVRTCNRTFSSASTLKKWLPAMLSHPHILLSSTIVASTWMDMHSGVAESRRTAVVKGEILSWIKDRVANTATLSEDSTLIVIIHMLAGEMFSCNEKTMRTHEQGVAKLISYRGGMDCLGGYGTVAPTLASVCYHSNIICEAEPLPIFAQWTPPPLPKDECVALPESPVFCPEVELFAVVRDPACAEYTYELLCDMRDLTDLFIAHSTGYGTVVDVEQEGETIHNDSSSLDYDTKLAEIRARLASLPSAHAQGLPTSSDWVYEACRIAAIIYTSAIVMRVPFSTAADPACNAIFLDAACVSHPNFNKRLTETLYEVLELTNIGDIWKNMSGVFYWVTAVGAAAARTPVTTYIYSRPLNRGEAYTAWIRRCLMMFATRAMIILVFQHPIPLNTAQKRLLEVQGLISSGSTHKVAP